MVIFFITGRFLKWKLLDNRTRVNKLAELICGKVRSGLCLPDSGARRISERLKEKKLVSATLSGEPFGFRVPEMVGHLHLQGMDDSLKGKNREGLLDSPDSGLPPSPSPPFCSLSPSLIESRSGSCTTPVESHHGYCKKESKEGKLLPYLLLNSTGTDPKTRMHPVFFGESIEVNPEPEQEIKCNSKVKYDSDKHYRDRVYCTPVPTATSFSETVVAVRNCTWRSYKSQVYLEPRQRPITYQSTTIIYPKHAKNIYRTTLNYNATGSRRWFVSTVQLESSEDTSPCIIYTEDL